MGGFGWVAMGGLVVGWVAEWLSGLMGPRSFSCRAWSFLVHFVGHGIYSILLATCLIIRSSNRAGLYLVLPRSLRLYVYQDHNAAADRQDRADCNALGAAAADA